ncbi:hypothetical protein P355_3021 [Burkholderia cenocepacia KC-01]|nr:hypothetical protein P355_3021 [Burkholderia cenocepacia KC-01]
MAAEMQKRRAKRDAFGGSVRRNRVVYFTRSGSGRIRRRQVPPGAGGRSCRAGARVAVHVSNP